MVVLALTLLGVLALRAAAPLVVTPDCPMRVRVELQPTWAVTVCFHQESVPKVTIEPYIGTPSTSSMTKWLPSGMGPAMNTADKMDPSFVVSTKTGISLPSTVTFQEVG